MDGMINTTADAFDITRDGGLDTLFIVERYDPRVKIIFVYMYSDVLNNDVSE